MICEEIPEAIPLMQNTDGLETIIPKSKVEQYYQICKRWEDLTLLQLEHDVYTKLVLGDVNNYISINEKGKAKCKGRFEFADLALHKNKSFLIIPKAIYEYFINGKDPEKYIKECTNIFDFCGGVKIKGDWKYVQTFMKDGVYREENLQNTVRYYISKSGSKILKKNKYDGRVIQVEAGKWMQTVYNKHEPKNISDYNIDYDYYINKVKKEIEGITPSVTQIKLF